MKTPREQKPDTGAAPAANDSRVFSNKGKTGQRRKQGYRRASVSAGAIGTGNA